MSEVIFVEELTKAYNGRTVVNHLNLSVKSGTVFGLLGANGAGKSTMDIYAKIKYNKPEQLCGVVNAAFHQSAVS